MSADKLIVVAAVGFGAYLLMKKQAVAAPLAARQAAQPAQTRNVNNELWQKILGGAWQQLLQSNGNSSSARPFVERNPWTGLFQTSDGKPLYTGNGATDYMVMNTGLYGDARDYAPIETGNVVNDTAVDNFMAGLGF